MLINDRGYALSPTSSFNPIARSGKNDTGGKTGTGAGQLFEEAVSRYAGSLSGVYDRLGISDDTRRDDIGRQVNMADDAFRKSAGSGSTGRKEDPIEFPLTPDVIYSLPIDKEEKGESGAFAQAMANETYNDKNDTEGVTYPVPDWIRTSESLEYRHGDMSFRCFGSDRYKREDKLHYVFAISVKGAIVGHGFAIADNYGVISFRYAIHKRFEGVGHGTRVLPLIMAMCVNREKGLFRRFDNKAFELMPGLALGHERPGGMEALTRLFIRAGFRDIEGAVVFSLESIPTSPAGEFPLIPADIFGQKVEMEVTGDSLDFGTTLNDEVYNDRNNTRGVRYPAKPWFDTSKSLIYSDGRYSFPLLSKVLRAAEVKHAVSFKDEFALLQRKNETAVSFIAVSNSWIKGYEPGKEQREAINPLISEIRNFCRNNRIDFIEGDDGKVAGEVNSLNSGARGIVLGGKEAVSLIEAHRKALGIEKNGDVLLAEVDSSALGEESYVRLMEMLSLMMCLVRYCGAQGDYIEKNKAAIRASHPDLGFLFDEERHIITFRPTKPENVEFLRPIYAAQASV